MENEVNTEANMMEPKSGGMGAIIGAIIIIILIAAGGWYFISNRVEKMQNQSSEVKDISTGTSSEIADIQTDLNNLDVNVLDQP